jgi:hypothetical protein
MEDGVDEVCTRRNREISEETRGTGSAAQRTTWKVGRANESISAAQERGRRVWQEVEADDEDERLFLLLPAHC